MLTFFKRRSVSGIKATTTLDINLRVASLAFHAMCYPQTLQGPGVWSAIDLLMIISKVGNAFATSSLCLRGPCTREENEAAQRIELRAGDESVPARSGGTLGAS